MSAIGEARSVQERPTPPERALGHTPRRSTSGGGVYLLDDHEVVRRGLQDAGRRVHHQGAEFF